MNTQLKSSIIVAAAILIIGAGALYKPSQEVIDDTVFKESVVASCVSPDTTYIYCSCAYDELKADVGINTLMAEELKYQIDGEFSDKFYSKLIIAANKCM